jgi:hypothetical protein
VGLFFFERGVGGQRVTPVADLLHRLLVLDGGDLADKALSFVLLLDVLVNHEVLLLFIKVLPPLVASEDLLDLERSHVFFLYLKVLYVLDLLLNSAFGPCLSLVVLKDVDFRDKRKRYGFRPFGVD